MEIDHTLRVYNGRCHCGAVRFTARTDLTGMMDCNCTHCRRRGSVLQPLAAADFDLLAGADDLKSYRFNTEKIDISSAGSAASNPSPAVATARATRW